MKDKFDSEYQKLNSKNETQSTHLSNTSTNLYDDYDKRPIKPLNENVFQKQLQEYLEISEDELVKIRQK